MSGPCRHWRFTSCQSWCSLAEDPGVAIELHVGRYEGVLGGVELVPFARPTTDHLIVQIARLSIWPVAQDPAEAAPAPANPTLAVMASPAPNAATRRNMSSSYRRRRPPSRQRSPGVIVHQIGAGGGESCPLTAKLCRHDADRESRNSESAQQSLGGTRDRAVCFPNLRLVQKGRRVG
jgi:hypothetical protein